MFEVKKLYDNRYIIGIKGEDIRSLTRTGLSSRRKRLKGIFGKTVFTNAVDAHVALAQLEAFRYIHSVLRKKGFLEAANAISTIAKVPCVPVIK